MRTIIRMATGMLLLLGAAAQAQPSGGAAAASGVPPVDETTDTNTDSTRDPSTPPGTNPTPAEPLETPAAVPATSYVTPTTARATATTPMLARVGMAVMVGGGFEDFTNDNLKGMTSGGGSWAARVVAGTRQLVGVEAAYIGAARSINGFGLGNDANLVSNGVEGAARFNVPILLGRTMLEPFAFIGLGWQHYRLMNAGNTNFSALNNSDDVLTLPYGAGIEFAYGMFIADARFTYRQTYLNDLMRVGGGRLSNWGAAAQLGVEF